MSVAPPVYIVRAGDSAISVEFEARVAPDVNTRAVALGTALAQAAYPGVRDIVTSYRAVAVYFDPLRTDVERLVSDIERLARVRPTSVDSVRVPIEVPVAYGGEDGPDLEAIARHAGCTEADVVRWHAAPIYRVYMVGFLPGFAYMGTVDPRIAIPRRSTPRLRVPRGSVAVAGEQTGIYPLETPGGWHLVGRTPVEPFDVDRDEPCLFKPGDLVRFEPMSGGRHAGLRGHRA